MIDRGSMLKIVYICITLTLWRCFNEDDGRGQNRREMFTFFVVPGPRLDPRTFHMPSEAHRRQATTVSYSCMYLVDYVFKI